MHIKVAFIPFTKMIEILLQNKLNAMCISKSLYNNFWVIIYIHIPNITHNSWILCQEDKTKDIKNKCN